MTVEQGGVNARRTADVLITKSDIPQRNSVLN